MNANFGAETLTEQRERTTERDAEINFNLDREIARQRKLGYETFTDYLTRTGFPNDEDSYRAWIGEGRWLMTSRDVQ